MTYPLLIAITVLIAYFRALSCGYVIDDIEPSHNKNEPKNRLQRFWWRIIGVKHSNPQLEHLITIVIHLCVCELIYFAFGRNNVSFIAALLFVVNPAGSQCSVWLSGKCYAIATGIVLLMFLSKWLTPLLYFAVFTFSVNSVLSPLIFLRSPFWFWGVLVLYGAWKILRHPTVNKRAGIATGVHKQIKGKKIIIFLKSLGYYACLALIPTRLGIYHTYLYTYGLSKSDNEYWEKLDRFFWIGAIILYILITNWIWNYNLAIFGLFWFVLFISQWCNIVTIQQAIAERYVYLPLVGMMLFLANMIMAIPDFTIRIIVFTAIFIYYITRLQLQIPAYDNIDNCIDYGRLNFPDCYVYWTWKGQLEKGKGGLFTALEAWFRGYRMRPSDFRLNNNIAVLLTDMGFLNDAEAFLNNAEESIIPEQKKIADEFIAYERERIAKARIILHNKAIEQRIKMPKFK